MYQQLSEEEKQKVTNLDVLENARKRIEALKDLGDQKGTVSLTIMDGIQADTQALMQQKIQPPSEALFSMCRFQSMHKTL